MILKFNSIKDLLDYRKECPICSKPLKCELFWSALFTDTLSPLRDSLTNNNKKDLLATFEPQNSSIINLERLDAKLDITNNRFLCKEYSDLITLKLSLYCEHEDLGREYEAFGWVDTYDSLTKDTVKESEAFGDLHAIYITKSNIIWEKCVVYNIAENLKEGNLIKVINNYEKEVTGMDISEISLDGSYEPRFQAFQRKLIDINTFKFNESQKIFTRINTFLLLK